MRSRWRHQLLYDTHLSVVINRAEFDASTPSSGRVKTYVSIGRAWLYTVV